MSGRYRALVVGGTGAVGSAVIRTLLASADCAAVIALTRREVDMFDGVPGSEKLSVEVVDLDALESEAVRVGAGSDVAFMTMGIGQPRKVSRELFWKVDVEYAGAFARGAARAGVRHISMLSSVGANAESRSYFVRGKGMAERAVEEAGIARTSIFRPSLLVTDEIRYGLQDRLTQAIFPWISPILPTSLRQIHVDDLGRAMVLNAGVEGAGKEVLYWADVRALL